MDKSKIFGEKELEEINLRMEGKKKNYRIWHYVKPKMLELLDWFEMKDKLMKLIKVKNERKK